MSGSGAIRVSLCTPCRTSRLRDAAQSAKVAKAEHNRLVRELVAKQQELLRQAAALNEQYAGPLGEVRQQLFALSAIVPVDLEMVAGGLYREQ